MPTDALRRRLYAPLKRPATLQDFIQSTVKIPAGNAIPGRMQLFAYQRGIAEAIGDPAVERVTVMKSVRVGYTALLNAAILHYVENDPTAILLVNPTEDDSRDQAKEVDAAAEASEITTLRPAEDAPTKRRGRRASSVTMARRFPGGSLKFLSAASPRTLRRHTARVLFCDEVDGYKITNEGNPVTLAERRTLSFPDRKIVLGSTPVDESTSLVLASYDTSDRRVFEVPCPHCGVFQELQWERMCLETAQYKCLHCDELIPEDHKAGMVEAGHWRATAPEVKGHAGFRLSALISTLQNASWPRLVAEYNTAVRTDNVKSFTNTLLGRAWREPADEISEEAAMRRRVPASLDNLPPDIVQITAGVDVQGDRIEVSLVGHTETNGYAVLSHDLLFEPGAWEQLDAIINRTWRHPNGGTIGVETVGVDSGYRTEEAYNYCRARRKCRALKGLAGGRPFLARASLMRGLQLYIAGVDTIKTKIMSDIAKERHISFSDALDLPYFEQLCSERRTVKWRAGRQVVSFEEVPGRRHEALDCLVYAIAVKQKITTAHVDAVTQPAGETVSTLTFNEKQRRANRERMAKLGLLS